MIQISDEMLIKIATIEECPDTLGLANSCPSGIVTDNDCIECWLIALGAVKVP